MTFQETIQRRVSVRTFSKALLSAGLVATVKRLIKQQMSPPFGNQARFHLLEKNKVEQDKKLKLGTYGFIKNARYFIVGAVPKNPFAEVDYGYQLEKIILELTDFELGTCWIGGTFKRFEFENAISLQSNEVIPCITPVGFPADKRRLTEKLIRRAAGSSSRKPWSELFFLEDWMTPLNPQDTEEYEPLFELVRLAPSASNHQPWRIVKGRGISHFLLSRTPGYRQQVKAADLQMVDMGIAMCHWELGAHELGISGRWVQEPPSYFLRSKEHEYVASWVD